MGTDSTKTRKQVLAFIAVSNIPAPRSINFQTWSAGEPGVSVTFDAVADLRAFLAYVLAPDESVRTWTQDSDLCAGSYCDWGGYRFQLWAYEPMRDTEPVDDETASALAAVLNPPPDLPLPPIFTTPTAPPPPVGGPSHPDGPAIPGLPSIEDDAWDEHADPVPLPHPVFNGGGVGLPGMGGESVEDGEMQCPARAYQCLCSLPPGHDGPHECDRDGCGGSWIGDIDGEDFDVVRFPDTSQALGRGLL